MTEPTVPTAVVPAQQPQLSEFEKNMKKAIALFKGEELFSKSKIDNDVASSIVDELFLERKEQMRADFKATLRELLSKKIEHDKYIKKMEDDLKKATAEKNKEFNEVLKKIFKDVEDINEIERAYTATLTNVQ